MTYLQWGDYVALVGYFIVVIGIGIWVGQIFSFFLCKEKCFYFHPKSPHVKIEVQSMATFWPDVACTLYR